MRLRPAAFLAALLASGAMFAAPARADLLITVDKSTQRMIVEQDGAELFVWPVSTGVAAHDTPVGTFKPFRMEKDHFSREWDDAPMPHSIFFTMKGHAIHGSHHKSLGQPASHGCVRLSPKNAATLFGLVKQETMAKTRVVLTGTLPRGDAPAVARREAPGNDFERLFSTEDDEPVAAVPPPRRRTARGWREYNNGPVYYYERQPRYYAAPPPRRYGYGNEVPPPLPPGFYYYQR